MEEKSIFTEQQLAVLLILVRQAINDEQWRLKRVVPNEDTNNNVRDSVKLALQSYQPLERALFNALPDDDYDYDLA